MCQHVFFQSSTLVHALLRSAGSTNCDANANNNAGCGVRASLSSTYGPAFNQAGGGWYAMERTPHFIKVYFWSRNANNVPDDVRNGNTVINTDKWGTPFAYFPSTDCDIDAYFGWHHIVINLTLCGDWAGSAFGGDGCHGSCVGE